MSETEPGNYDKDIENFTHDIGIAIHDLNKKHNNIFYRTNLGNAMCEYFRFVKDIKKNRIDEKKDVEF